ncbi:flavin-dependent reductase [Leifsonia xyli subsp. cynodontis DSM 46306]|uniref:Amino acid deaminase n=1 Tax=Leifsonia xyli subsp. cynodontis DSM 46306 TaxID=1389489 RepID=U3P4J8_LEIXC|nr:flavin-dependent reductase [Leifsonia xyli]AGW40349.1 flavin-dependent reductase [Leifsonia xyli subsp. cynodontis DSM 46306]
MEEYKAAPLGYTAADVAALGERRPPLAGFPTPLVTLSEAALAHNLETIAAWCREAAVGIAPHGKTTMNRELWQRQLDAGA